MPPTNETPTTIEGLDAAGALELAEERRRPGRPAVVSPLLLPLLRDNAQVATDSPALCQVVQFSEERRATPMEGILIAIGLGTLLWGLIGWVVYEWVR